MPKIYSDAKRMEIKEEILHEGFLMIKDYGLKKTNIAQLTKQVGIAQGTFYHFFQSKEMMIVAIIRAYQLKITKMIDDLVECNGGLGREDVENLYRWIFLKDDASIFRYLSREDLQVIISHLPKEQQISFSTARVLMESMLINVNGKKIVYDLACIYNWIQLLNFCVENRDLLAPEAFDKTFDGILENLLNEIFEIKENN